MDSLEYNQRRRLTIDKEEFAVEDYKLKLEHLQGQFQRLWHRFGFFLTVQLAIFGFLGTASDEVLCKGQTYILSCSLGIFVSTIWYIVASQDRYLVKEYRQRTNRAANKILDLGLVENEDYEGSHVGASARRAEKIA